MRRLFSQTELHITPFFARALSDFKTTIVIATILLKIIIIINEPGPVQLPIH